MSGSSNITGQESIVFADNLSLDGTERGGAFNADGQLWIGSTAATPTHVKRSTLTAGSGITITNGPGTITIASTNAPTPSILNVDVDAATAPGTDPVPPTGAGVLGIHGGATFATGTQANPIRTNSLVANSFDIQTQLSGANVDTSTANNFGVSQADASMFTVTSGYWKIINPSSSVVASNLGLSLSGGVLTLSAQDGTALSTTNPGYVSMPVKTSQGLTQIIRITTNFTLRDSTAGSGSTVNNNRFGLDSNGTPNFAAIMYVYIALADDGTTYKPFISRYPHYKKMPVSGSIFSNATATANLESDFLCWDNITNTDYDGNPCVNIGSFQMLKNSGSNDWTFQALLPYNGINRYNEEAQRPTFFNQSGAATNTYFIPNGGTAATGGSVPYQYRIFRNGVVHCEAWTETPFNGNGAGAQLAKFTLPYLPKGVNVIAGSGLFSASGGDQILTPLLNGNSFVMYRTAVGVGLTWANVTTATTMALSWNFDYMLPDPPL